MFGKLRNLKIESDLHWVLLLVYRLVHKLLFQVLWCFREWASCQLKKELVQFLTCLLEVHSQASVFCFGIIPYISASIVVQLMELLFLICKNYKVMGKWKRLIKLRVGWQLEFTVVQGQLTSIIYIERYCKMHFLLGSIHLYYFHQCYSGYRYYFCCMWLGRKITDKGIGMVFLC
jgi:preprotein translocase subunit SecY